MDSTMNYSNGIGTPSEKQVEYARLLIDQTPDWANLYGTARMNDRIRATTLWQHACMGSPYDADGNERDVLSIMRTLYDEAIQWVRSLDLSQMSRDGISRFIDSMKVNVVVAYRGQ